MSGSYGTPAPLPTLQELGRSSLDRRGFYTVDDPYWETPEEKQEADIRAMLAGMPLPKLRS